MEKMFDRNGKQENIMADLTYIAEIYDIGPKTTIFNEDWLLKVLLYLLKNDNKKTKVDAFLSFPEKAEINTKIQLYTPFAQRKRSDQTGEDNINADGIVGEYRFIPGTKSIIQLNENFSHFSIFESKVLSGLSSVRHKGTWNQISRTIAGMIYSALLSKTNLDKLPDLNYNFVYSSENQKIDITKYNIASIKNDIHVRISLYKTGGQPKNQDFSDFETNWERIFDKNMKITFQKWENIVESFGNAEFEEFYNKCLEYNRRPSSISNSTLH